MDIFPSAESNDLAVDGNFALYVADQSHFDSAQVSVPASRMTKGFKWKIAIEFPVDALQEVEIELRGHAEAIIVCALQLSRVFSQIDTDQHPAPGTDLLDHTRKEFQCFRGFEISDGRARKINDSPTKGPTGRRNLDGRKVVGADGADDQAWVALRDHCSRLGEYFT